MMKNNFCKITYRNEEDDSYPDAGGYTDNTKGGKNFILFLDIVLTRVNFKNFILHVM